MRVVVKVCNKVGSDNKCLNLTGHIRKLSVISELSKSRIDFCSEVIQLQTQLFRHFIDHMYDLKGLALR